MDRELTVFIAEDEAPARERLLESLARVAPQAKVLGWAASVTEAAAWLQAHAAPDLLLLDVQLADGLSFELFRDGRLQVPTIFITAYDEYALQAFRAHAIDYLLKPLDEKQLAGAFASHSRLRRHFTADVLDALQRPAQRHRERLVGKLGVRSIVLPLDRVAYLASVDKASYAITFEGERYLLDEALSALEAALSPADFFRVNRQCIVNVAAIEGFKPTGKGRLALQLKPAAEEEVQVSQERASAFRDWLVR